MPHLGESVQRNGINRQHEDEWRLKMGESRYKVVKHKGKVDYYLVFDAFGGGWMWCIGDTCSHFLSREEAEKTIRENGFTGCTVEPV